MLRLQALLPRDPRVLQLVFLTSFLTAGFVAVSFDCPLWEPPVLLASALTTQWLLARREGRWDLGLRSAAITALGLSLLLRTDVPWLIPLAAIVAVGGKFFLRIQGKHVFNPTNFGLGALMLLTPHAWCSPSQWGESAVLLAWFLVLGLAVVSRAFRSDISLAFLASWILLKGGRVLYLGQRPQVLLHQLSVGSLLLFAFFMISDPKTTPDHRGARLAFGAAVAALAFFLQHQLWWQNTPIWALLFLSPLVPLLDRALRASRFAWPERTVACSAVSPLP